MTDNTCHVCYDKVSKGVTCENGHTCCQKHHLERIRAIYQEGQLAFDSMGQHCFICRCPIKDDRFSKEYFNCLKVIITIGVIQNGDSMGRISDEHPLDVMKRVELTIDPNLSKIFDNILKDL